MRLFCQGLLEKKSDFLGRYNTRFVRLSQHGTLHWYIDDQIKTAKGSISLAHAEISTQDEEKPPPTSPSIGEDGEASPTRPTALLLLKVRSGASLFFRCPDSETCDKYALSVSNAAQPVVFQETNVLILGLNFDPRPLHRPLTST